MNLEELKLRLAADKNGILDALDCTFLSDPTTSEILSHAYLSAEQRRDHDLMNHVVALNTTNALCTFVFSYGTGELLGFWHGPKRSTADQSDIVVHDTEGHYEIVPANNLAEALCYWQYYSSADEDEFSWLIDAFSNLDITIRPITHEALDAAFLRPNELRASIEPNSYCDAVYEQLV